MMLCLDAGNSRLKWGLREGGAWRAQGACEHAAIAAIAALAGQLPARPERVVACNVAGESVATALETLAGTLGAPLRWFGSEAAACGVTNGYDVPAQLGADRWAALIGARAIHPGDCLVVIAGTATTVDVLDASGRFHGGLILPGLGLMRAALAKNTAGLPEARGSYRELPANTDDAIASGALHATLGAIERMARRAGRADFRVILSGGAADALAPHVGAPLLQVNNLVLEGLARAEGG